MTASRRVVLVERTAGRGGELMLANDLNSPIKGPSTPGGSMQAPFLYGILLPNASCASQSVSQSHDGVRFQAKQAQLSGRDTLSHRHTLNYSSTGSHKNKYTHSSHKNSSALSTGWPYGALSYRLSDNRSTPSPYTPRAPLHSTRIGGRPIV